MVDCKSENLNFVMGEMGEIKVLFSSPIKEMGKIRGKRKQTAWVKKRVYRKWELANKRNSCYHVLKKGIVVKVDNAEIISW